MTRLRLIALIFLAVLLTGLPAYGQIYQANQSYTTTTVPFAFVVTDIDGVNHALPAGDYSLTGLTPSLLLLKGGDTTVLVGTDEQVPSSEIKESKLVFVQMGGQYVLHQIWTADHKHVHNLVHAGGIPDV